MNPLVPDATVADIVGAVAIIASGGGLAVFLRRFALAWHPAWRFERASKNGWESGTLADVLDTANGRRRQTPPR